MLKRIFWIKPHQLPYHYHVQVSLFLTGKQSKDSQKSQVDLHIRCNDITSWLSHWKPNQEEIKTTMNPQTYGHHIAIFQTHLIFIKTANL